MNRRLVVSILAMLLVLTMILSLVLTVIPVRADGVEQTLPTKPRRPCSSVSLKIIFDRI